MAKLKNAMTVDVEDYFQVSAFENHVERDSWNGLNTRVEANIDRILMIFSESNISATFFTLGWIAERHPAMVKKIVNAGHELASHGYSHIRIAQQKVKEFREDIKKTKHILEDISGKAVIGYRAASFSINATDHWAYQELQTAGFKYSSSIYPVKHDLYGIPKGPRFPFTPDNSDILEVPISTLEIMGARVPCGGGGYFRLFPYSLSSWLIRRINNREGKSCIFYFHPWELDIDQPRIENVSVKTRFRHYNGLKRMEPKLRKLINSFDWDRMDRIFLG